LFFDKGIIVFRGRGGRYRAICSAGGLIFQLKVDASAGSVRYRPVKQHPAKVNRPGTLAVVPVISKAAEVRIWGYYATASCSSSQKEMHRVSVRVMPDQAFDAGIIKLLMRLRLPPQNTFSADTLVKIMLTLRPAERDNEHEISRTPRDLDQASNSPQPSLRHKAAGWIEEVMDVLSAVIVVQDELPPGCSFLSGSAHWDDRGPGSGWKLMTTTCMAMCSICALIQVKEKSRCWSTPPRRPVAPPIPRSSPLAGLANESMVVWRRHPIVRIGALRAVGWWWQGFM
jgi:hypothetical protein